MNPPYKTLTLLAMILIAMFAYKVWNERQMTYEYRAQAKETQRLADKFAPSISDCSIHFKRDNYYSERLDIPCDFIKVGR